MTPSSKRGRGFWRSRREIYGRNWVSSAIDYPVGALVYVLGGWGLVALYAGLSLFLGLCMWAWAAWEEAS